MYSAMVIKESTYREVYYYADLANESIILSPKDYDIRDPRFSLRVYDYY